MNKDLEIVDLWKFIASIIVVAIHTSTLNATSNFFISNIWNSISILAVPFFFISTGYLSFYKSKSINIGKVKKVLLKFLKIYFICILVYLPITICYYIYSDYSFFKSVLYFIRSVLFIGENYNSWPLWYLLSSIYAFLILYIFCKLRYSEKKILITSLILFIIGLVITIISNTNCTIFHILKIFNYFINIVFGGTGRLLYGIGYITIGIFLGHNGKDKSISILSTAILFIILLITPKTFKIVSAVPFMYFAFLDIVKFNKKIPLLNHSLLRTMSSVTYFTHMIFYTIIELIVGNYNYKGLVPFSATLFLTWICGIIYYHFKSFKNNNENKCKYTLNDNS